MMMVMPGLRLPAAAGACERWKSRAQLVVGSPLPGVRIDIWEEKETANLLNWK
jgi:hypothetical protein